MTHLAPIGRSDRHRGVNFNAGASRASDIPAGFTPSDEATLTESRGHRFSLSPWAKLLSSVSALAIFAGCGIPQDPNDPPPLPFVERSEPGDGVTAADHMDTPHPAVSPLPASLVRSESGGNLQALNSEGYGGRGQFGAARLRDAYNAGIIDRPMTGAEYSHQPESVQAAVESWHRADILSDLGQYVGYDVDGDGPIPPLTENSILAIAHLGGTGGARRFIESGGAYDPADSNGTHLSDYARMHAGPT